MKKIFITFFAIIFVAFGASAQDIDMSSPVKWYSRAISGAIKNSEFTEEQKIKFADAVLEKLPKNNEFAIMDFLVLCVDVLNDKEKCINMGLGMVQRHNAIFDMKDTKPKLGDKCNSLLEGIFYSSGTIERISNFNVKEEINSDITIIYCHNGVWVSEDEYYKNNPELKEINKVKEDTKKEERKTKLTETQLMQSMRIGCINQSLIRTQGGQKKMYYDCDVEKQRCMYAVETENNSTMYFCCEFGEYIKNYDMARVLGIDLGLTLKNCRNK